jgi:hypothetical protein
MFLCIKLKFIENIDLFLKYRYKKKKMGWGGGNKKGTCMWQFYYELQNYMYDATVMINQD